ncbi:MAG TPA: cell division ATP-binding protein FtsE [Nitrospiria bacterium]|nr:cell division ATP-binding protein FtsE [Nitrospiria bacterium]
MIQFSGVYKGYRPNHYHLKDINFTIEKGEFVFLTGSSGAGKTTLLKILFCEERPDQGNILVQGQNIARLKPSAVPYYRRNIGFIFQDFRLILQKTVFENVALALRVLHLSQGEIRKKVGDTLALVGLEFKKDLKCLDLSGGEQQRVCIARAFVNRPPIILADEPTGNLDFDLSVHFLSLLKDIQARGTTIIVATHNRELVEVAKKRVIHIKEGHAVSHASQGKSGSPL